MTDDIRQLAERLDGLGEELEQAMRDLNEADPVARPSAYTRHIETVDACRRAVESYGKVVAQLLSVPPRIIYGTDTGE